MRPLFFATLFILSLFEPLMAQQRKISTSDELSIMVKAQKLITNLAYQYNQIITSENDERTILIRNLTSPVDNSFAPFIDDQVIIEDDFTTIGNLPKNERDKIVDAYFQNIGLYYGKSDNGDFLNQDKKVEFRNITFSKIMLNSAKDSLYTKTYFDVKYDGIDNRTQKAFIEPCHRVAELQAHKTNGVWKVFINSISFYNPQKDIDNSKNVLVQKKEDIISKQPVDEVKSSVASTIVLSPPPVLSASPALEALKAELSSYKSKKAILKILGLGALGVAGGIFAAANGKYSDYTNKVDENNAAYTRWHRDNLNGQPPPSDELAKPVSMSEYISPSFIPISGAVVVGLGLFLWGNKYGKLSRETRAKIENFKKKTAFIPTINTTDKTFGFSISYKF